MDVNGTRIHLAIGREGWFGTPAAPARVEGLAYVDNDDTLRLEQIPFTFPESLVNRRLGQDDRRGADADAFGTVYWIGPDRRTILVRGSGDDVAEPFWPLAQPCDDRSAGDFVPHPTPPPAAQRLAGLAVTTSHHLVVGAPDLPGVLVFDLHGGGPPFDLRWPDALDPIDMTAAQGGGVWILDRAGGAGPRLWALDGALRICNLAGLATLDQVATFRPHPDAGAPPGDQVPEAQPPSPVPAVGAEPVAVMCLGDGTVLLLDRGAGGAPALWRQDGAAAVGGPLPLEVVGGAVLDAAFVPDPDGDGIAGQVLVADGQGDQAVAYGLDVDPLDPDALAVVRLTRYLPMRLFTGKALVVGPAAALYDSDERWLPLVDTRRCRHADRGSVELTPFDGGLAGTVWHRLDLDGRIPQRCEVRVRTRAADDLADLAAAPWEDEPRPYRRGDGSEIPYHSWGDAEARDEGTFEVLLQSAVGRHLQVRLELSGDGTRTPRLWALRVHDPRFDYLEQYLPDVYAEDPFAADFLTRYLANVEGLLTTVEGRVAQAQRLFDADTVPVGSLPWLAGWVGAIVDETWDEARTRLFLHHAVALFSRRGTVRGLREMIDLTIHACPDEAIFDPTSRNPFGVRIVEAFRSRDVPGVVFGDPTDITGPRLVEVGERWILTDGVAALDRRWVDHVRSLHGGSVVPAWGRLVQTDASGDFDEPFRPLTPTSATEAADRRAFLDAQVAATYDDVGTTDAAAWQQFLAQRYERPAVYAAAWSRTTTPTTFADVALPTVSLPADGPPLHDWIAFVSTVLPRRRAAHRFDVLVPTVVGDTDEAREDRLDQVRRIVERERPAHTAFTITPYWAAFRVGEARVGLETVAGESSRYTAVVLDRTRLGQGHLTARRDVGDRLVVGRERVRAGSGRQAAQAQAQEITTEEDDQP